MNFFIFQKRPLPTRLADRVMLFYNVGHDAFFMVYEIVRCIFSVKINFCSCLTDGIREKFADEVERSFKAAPTTSIDWCTNQFATPTTPLNKAIYMTRRFCVKWCKFNVSVFAFHPRFSKFSVNNGTHATSQLSSAQTSGDNDGKCFSNLFTNQSSPPLYVCERFSHICMKCFARCRLGLKLEQRKLRVCLCSRSFHYVYLSLLFASNPQEERLYFDLR